MRRATALKVLDGTSRYARPCGELKLAEAQGTACLLDGSPEACPVAVHGPIMHHHTEQRHPKGTLCTRE